MRRRTYQEKHPLLVLFFGTSGCLQLTYLCYFCLVSCTIATLMGYGRFLEQPQFFINYIAHDRILVTKARG